MATMHLSNYITLQRVLLYPIVMVLIVIFMSGCVCESAQVLKDETKAKPSFQPPLTTDFDHSAKSRVKPSKFTAALTAETLTTKESIIITKMYSTTGSPSTARNLLTKTYTSIKGSLKSASRQKLNISTSALGNGAHSSSRFQDRLEAIYCDLPVLPRESRLWRGNETHELNLPVTECAGGHSGGTTAGAVEEVCPPVIVSWEGSADIQSGDILIVRITDSSLLDTLGHVDPNNATIAIQNSSSSSIDADRAQHALNQPAVYQVTRQGHEHCDISDGMLLDITPLDEHGAKLFTLYDKDLAEGDNLLIVVSENWRSQCVRLKVTVKSDNCGEAQDCSGKGVCYTNVSMEGYECQCCAGYIGSHCEERDACDPSPCLNNGICIDLPKPFDGVNYSCLCPSGYTGFQCEKDPCYWAPCLNGGSCITLAMNRSTTFHCACADGWTGVHCELPTTGGACAAKPCVKGICLEQTDSDENEPKYRCFCEPGYTGDKCEVEYNECESSPCANGGTCTDRVGKFDCTCGRGYTGNTCQLKVDLCSPDPCPSQRFCVDHGNSYSCDCPRGYIGEECHIPSSSACDNNPCAHGGTCWSGVDSFYCSCRPGYTGKLCEEDFILESVVEGEGEGEGGDGGVAGEARGSSVREMRLPLGLYHDRLHNVYIAAGTLGAAIAIVGIVVTACHCRVNKTYSRLLSRLSSAGAGIGGFGFGAGGALGARGAGGAVSAHHWLQDKRAPAHAPALAQPAHAPSAALDTTDMYYTLDFSDSQSSPLIQ